MTQLAAEPVLEFGGLAVCMMQAFL